MWEIPCRRLENYLILDRHKLPKGTREVVMTFISEEEEKLIDNLKENHIVIRRGKRIFKVYPNNIYCYGEVDFKNDDDIKQINSFNFITRDFQGYIIPSNYDYDKHIAYSDNRKSYKYTETWNSGIVAKYAHGCLGKPKRIIIFNNC